MYDTFSIDKHDDTNRAEGQCRVRTMETRYLHCCAENSSPETLRDMARNAGEDLPDATMEERRARLSELVQDSKMWPSDSEIMNTTLRLIANQSEPNPTRVQGLRMLKDIVEDTLLANGTARVLSSLIPLPPPLPHRLCSA